MAEDKQSPRRGFTRRRFLGTAAAAAGTASVGMNLFPPNLQRALAAPIARSGGSLRDIEHVVLLMQENRSFDHYFGTMSGVEGFSDRHAIELSTGHSVFYQPTDTNPDGYLLPFHLDSHKTSAQWITSAGGYSWPISHAAWDEGKMDSWLPASFAGVKGDQTDIPLLMGYFQEADLPFHRALADAFTICDHYHCSLLGPTSPNRLYWETGTIDPNGTAGGPILGDENVVKDWPTYAEALTDAGVSWKFYQVDGGMTSATKLFKNFQDAPTTSPLYQNSQIVADGQFEYDALNDQLPTVSWLWPGPGQNEHPNEGIPAAGAQFIAGKLDAIAANPEVWAKTVFVLVWDENGGFFDHVPPPTPPAGTPDEFVTLDSPTGIAGDGYPIGGGFRVGCIIVSPWTAGGWVCSEPFDHTSNLQFLEKVTGVAAPNITAWRRQTFGDLTSALRFDTHAVPPVLPDTTGGLTLAQYEVANLPAPAVPGAPQQPPTQEPGRRPVTPSPSPGRRG